MRYRLGKLPARPGAVRLKFGAVFDHTKLPTPPLVFGYESIRTDWGMLGNDQHSNCVFAGAAHETMAWAHESRNKIPRFDDRSVLADYSAVTGYNPSNPDSDGGTDMSQAAEYRRTVGIVDADGVRHKVDSYVALRPKNLNELAIATYLCGGVGIGLEMPDTAGDQFDRHEPWHPVPGAQQEGGHYVPVFGRNSAGNFLIVTWGRLHAVTPEFLLKYMDEGIAYVSLESMLEKTKATPDGFDIDFMRSQLAALAA